MAMENGVRLMLFAFRDCWSYEMDLVRNNLTDMYAPSRNKSSNPAKCLYTFTESSFRSAMASENLALFGTPER